MNHLMARAEEAPGSQLVVDLETQTVATVDGSFVRKFEIDGFVRHCLINGLDDIGLTLQNEGDISAFEQKRGDAYPSLTAAG